MWQPRHHEEILGLRPAIKLVPNLPIHIWEGVGILTNDRSAQGAQLARERSLVASNFVWFGLYEPWRCIKTA